MTKELISLEDLRAVVETTLDENKADDVIFVDLPKGQALADIMVIASGRSSRQVKALADYTLRGLKKLGYKSIRVEGLPQADWVLIDAGDIIIHLFRPEVRGFYNIERIWAPDHVPLEQSTQNI